MAIINLVRRVLKIAYYIIVSLIVARLLGNPELWPHKELLYRLAHFLYGPGETGADNLYDFFFYISVLTVFPVTTLIYFLTMKLIRKLRSK